MNRTLISRKAEPGYSGGQKLPAGLKVSRPGDTFELEADRVANAVVTGERVPQWSITNVGMDRVQRQTADSSGQQQQQPKPNNYAEGGQKLAEAFMQTDTGKKILQAVTDDPLVKAGENFLATLPGKIITGAAAVGTVAALAAEHKALPVQIPAIPLGKLSPKLEGASVKITYEGPVDKPTQAMITFSYTPGASKKKKETETEKTRADTARIAADQDKFRAGMTYAPGSDEAKQQAADQKMFDDYALHRIGTPLPGTGGVPLGAGYGATEQQNSGLKLPTLDERFKPKTPTLLDRKLELKLELKPMDAAPPIADDKKKEETPVRRKATGDVAGVEEPAALEGIRSGSQRLDSATRHFMESRMGHGFERVRIHADEEADRLSRAMKADAFTIGEDVFFRAGNYAPSSTAGKRLLAHELTHVAQYHGGLLGRSEQTLENQADRAGRGENVFRGRSLYGAPTTRRVLKQAAGQHCTGITITLPDNIVLYGSDGPMSAKVNLEEDLPPGSYSVTYEEKTHELKVDVKGSRLLQVTGSVRGTKAQIAAQQKKWQNYLDSLVNSPVTLTVQGKGAATGITSGAGTGAGGTGTGSQDPDGPGGKKKGAHTDKTGGTAPAGGKDGGKPGGTGGGSKQPAPGSGGGGAPGTSPVPQQGSGGVVVQITDLKQIDELKRRGLLDGKTGDDIKDRAAKGQPLTFEETIELFDALSQAMAVHAPGDKKETDKKSGEKKESWVDVAKFIEANKDKFSGQQATGADGITLDEMKEILAKSHEFVGVKDAAKPGQPRTSEQRVEKFDPEKRKSWNTLAPWEKDIWKKYTAKYGEPSADSSTTDDLHLTLAMKFSIALHMSPNFMKEGAREAAHALFNDPIFIGGTMLSIALYIAAWLAPEPLFSKAFAAGVTFALLTVFSVSEIRNVAVAWMRLQDESAAATSFEDLEAAAENFGKSIGGVGLRVLVMLATIFASKALPTPEPPPSGGGGGMVPATDGPPIDAIPDQAPTSLGGVPPKGTGGVPPRVATGPQGTGGGGGAGAAAGTGVKVLGDGTVVIVGPGAGDVHQSSMAGGGGGGGARTGGGGGGGGGVKTGGPSGEPPQDKMKVKDEAPPEDTQGIKAPRVAGPDVEQQQGVGKQVGNFAHPWYERLVEFTTIKDVVSDDVPEGAEKEHVIKNPAYKDPRFAPRIDRLDWRNGWVIEIKPNSLFDQGFAEAKAYAQEMNKYESLPDGRSWQPKCFTYDFDIVLDYLEKIGYLSEKEVADFREQQAKSVKATKAAKPAKK